MTGCAGQREKKRAAVSGGWSDPTGPLSGRLPEKAEGRQPAYVVDEGDETVCVVCRESVCSRNSKVFSKLSPKRQTKHFREKTVTSHFNRVS